MVWVVAMVTCRAEARTGKPVGSRWAAAVCKGAQPLGTPHARWWADHAEAGVTGRRRTCGCTPSSSMRGVMTTAPPRPNMPAIRPPSVHTAGNTTVLLRVQRSSPAGKRGGGVGGWLDGRGRGQALPSHAPSHAPRCAAPPPSPLAQSSCPRAAHPTCKVHAGPALDLLLPQDAPPHECPDAKQHRNQSRLQGGGVGGGGCT
jgi:hypothetical protein